jgi:hypothetical protein
MGRGRPRAKKVHAAFADGLGGLLCGARRAGAVVAAIPNKVTCRTCRAFMERHPARKPPSPPSIAGVCKVCGCTDDDCSGCVERTGAPCLWVEADLCSACVGGQP